MNDLPTAEHARWFADVRTILAIVEVTAGLPLPVISSLRASFYFTAIPRTADARAAVASARDILSDALGLTFAPGTDPTGNHTLEAALPSGLLVVITAKAQHMPGYVDARIAERLAVIQGAADEVLAATQPRSAA